ncbi:MAG: MMPL family transporter [Pirellulales bacterium]
MTFVQIFADLIVRFRWPLLGLGLLIAAAAWLPAERLKFDETIETMFSHHDPLLGPFRQLKRTFGGDEVVLAAYTDPQLMTPAGLERVEKLRKELAATPGVQAALSLGSTPAGAAIVTPGPLSQALVNLFEGYLIGPDKQTTAVLCVLQPKQVAKTSRRGTIDALRRTVEAHAPDSGVLAGEPVMIADGFRYLERDGKILATTSTVLLSLTILFCFRSVRWVLIPLALVQWTILVNEALLSASGAQLTMVSSMLDAVITVVGIATVMHVIVRYREVRERGKPPERAMRMVGASLASPVFWAIATDAMGFGSLLVTSVGPVQDFGLMMALGSLLVMPAVILLVPGLGLAGKLDADPKPAWGEHWLDAGLRKLVGWVHHHPWPVALTTLGLTALFSIGILWLGVETDFTKNFRAGSPIVRSYDFVETRLGGAGIWDVIVPAPRQLDQAFLDKLARLEQRLRSDVVLTDAAGQKSPGLTKVLGLPDVLAVIPALPGGVFAAALPVEPKVKMVEAQLPEVVRSLRGRDPDDGQNYVRIMLRARERQTAENKQQLIADVTRIAREEFPQAQVTGIFVLLASLIDSLVRDQWLTFLVATTGIGIMLLIALRSFRLTVIALVPNVFPTLMVTGLLGWLGLKLNMGAAMIAAVSMGMSVDSAIHYLQDYLELRRKERPVRAALEAAHESAGRAMVFSTLALVVGFSALAMSEFIPTIYFGVLVSLTMLGGLAGNLVVLPLLLTIVDGRGAAEQRGK